jgi:hypothetical protein
MELPGLLRGGLQDAVVAWPRVGERWHFAGTVGVWRHGRGWASVGASLERSTLRVDCPAVLAAGGRAQNSPSLCSVLRQLRSTPLSGATLRPLRSSAFQRRAATHPPAAMLRRGVVSYSLPFRGRAGVGARSAQVS